MTKRITLLFAIFAVLLSFYLPKKFSKSIKQCSFVVTEKQQYAEAVYGNGYIVEEEFNEVYLECPVIANSVNVKIGQKVNEGDIIANINTKLTKSVLDGSITVSKTNDIINQIPIDSILEKAKSYGINLDLIPTDKIKQNISSIKDTESDIVIPKNIVSPLNGVITDLNIKQGVLLNSDKPAVRISNINNLVAEVLINENDINKVKVGATAMIEPTATNFKAYTGKVDYIYPVANNSDFEGGAQVKVVISIDNIDNNLKPNFTANAKIYVGNEKSIDTLPYEAILQDKDNKEYVYVYDKGKAKKVFINTGTELTECTEITSGITNKDFVLVNTKDIENGDFIKLKGEFINDI